ncbi:MAG: hypothetical protein WC637_23250 [Victivallales bacterium]|jgi:hypothetical protein
MIMHPAIIALFIGSLIVGFMVLYAAWHGVEILRRWDIRSGSELQLRLERRTYLISTIMSCAFCFQLFSLFLFIFTADNLSRLLVGAMCAAGSLNANAYGYPAMLFKIVNFILGGVWLIVNHTDNKAVDYPLIRKKYFFLLLIAPSIVAEMLLQGAFFLKLDAHVITSCCGSIFSGEGKGVGAAFTSVSVLPVKTAFYSLMLISAISGLLFYFRGKPAAGIIFALTSVAGFLVSVAALISFISVYIYQLPTHHCPFCILQREYWYVGYVLYFCLSAGVVAGASVGVLMFARGVESLKDVLPMIQKRLTLASLLFQMHFLILSTCPMIFTNFKLLS